MQAKSKNVTLIATGDWIHFQKRNSRAIDFSNVTFGAGNSELVHGAAWVHPMNYVDHVTFRLCLIALNVDLQHLAILLCYGCIRKWNND